MAIVGAKIGMTLKLPGGTNFEFIRPEVSIEGIDIEKNISEQLAEARKTLVEVWKEVCNFIESEVMIAIESNEKTKGLVTKKLKDFEIRIKNLEANLEEAK